MATAERSFLFRATFCGEHKIRICADSLPQLFANFWHCFRRWRHKNAIKHKECGGWRANKTVGRSQGAEYSHSHSHNQPSMPFPLSTFPQLITRVCIIAPLSFNLVSTLDRIQCGSLRHFRKSLTLSSHPLCQPLFWHFFFWQLGITLMHM